MKAYSTYLFDVDGTLLDTAELIYQCFKYSCFHFKKITLEPQQVMPYIGLPFRRQLETYIGPVSDTLCDEIFVEHMRFQKENYSSYLRAFDGVVETLTALRNAGKRLGIVTSRKKDTLFTYLSETNILDFFETIVTPEDTVNHKPSGDPILKAMENLSSNQASSIYIGDSVYDIEAGFNAGIDTAFVSWSMVPSTECHVAPTVVIDSISDLLK